VITVLERNTMHPGGNAQPREEYRRGSYRGRRGQIT